MYELPNVRLAGEAEQAALEPYRWLLGQRAVEMITFEEGEDLLREGSCSDDPRAWLVVEGEIEERMTVYLPGQGMVEQPFFLACSGDLVNVQALVSAYQKAPAIGSLHAVGDGWAACVRPDMLPSTGGIFAALFQKTVEAMERERQMLALYGSVASLFQHASDSLPFVPADPRQMMQRLVHALEERGYLSRSQRGVAHASADRVRVLEEQNKALRDQLERTTKGLSTALGQCRALEQKYEFESRARTALEQRLSELMQKVVERPEDPLSSRFPTAVAVLESKELEELERAARHHRRLAEQLDNRANRLHRAIELLEHDNPAMIIAEDVMMLMLGEEPPPREPESSRNTIPLRLDPNAAPSAQPPSQPVPIQCPAPSSFQDLDPKT
jgi:hypothetical protein